MNDRLQLMTTSGWRTVAQSEPSYLDYYQAAMKSVTFFHELLQQIARLAKKISEGEVGLQEKHDSALELSLALGGPSEWRRLPAWEEGMRE
jgi:hypothetical protein